MTPAARVQAAVEILDQVIASARDDGSPADAIVTRYFKARRYAGSKDRRAVRELVFRAIRRSGERPASGRAAMLGLADDDALLLDLFDGSPHGPTPREPAEEVVEEPTVASNDAPALEPAPVAVATETAPEPIVIVQQPTAETAPAPIPVSSGPADDGRSVGEGGIGERRPGGGVGGLLGGIIGAVVIRGGHGGVDKCDPRTDGRRGRGGVIARRPVFGMPSPVGRPTFPSL